MTDINTLFQLARDTPLPEETDHELAKRFAREIYDTYCPKIVKKEMGTRRMARRLSKILEKMIMRYRENLIKAKECYIIKYDDDSEEVEETKVYFNEKTYPFEKMVDEMSYDQMNVPKEMDFRGLVQVKKNHSMQENVLNLFYDGIRDYVYCMHHCMELRDIFSALGFEDHYQPDNTKRYNNIHKDCLAFCATNCS